MKRFLMTTAALCWAATAAAQGYRAINPDARSLGLGGVETVVAADAQAIYNNPAATAAGFQQIQVAASLLSLRDHTVYAAAGYWKIDSRNVLLGGWRGYRFGAAARDKSVNAGYARRLNDRASVGVTVDYARFVRDETGNALSAGLSASYVLPFEGESMAQLRLGAKLTGLGGFLDGPSRMKLPVGVAAGAAYDFFAGDAHELTFVAECRYDFSPAPVRGVQGGVGVEYNLMQLLQFRAGYHVGEARLPHPDYFAAGVGVRFMHLCFDFGYAVAGKHSPLRNACLFTVGFDF